MNPGNPHLQLRGSLWDPKFTESSRPKQKGKMLGFTHTTLLPVLLCSLTVSLTHKAQAILTRDARPSAHLPRHLPQSSLRMVWSDCK